MGSREGFSWKRGSRLGSRARSNSAKEYPRGGLFGGSISFRRRTEGRF
jgi:hypothetical protein